MAPIRIAIIGNGIAGTVLALSLPSTQYTIEIYELRSTPSTLGGAINLTPPGIRQLESLGICLSSISCPVEKITLSSYHTGASMGSVPFGPAPDQCAVRIMRHRLHKALLDKIAERGVEVGYGMKLERIEERSSDDEGEEGPVQLFFANGKEAQADLVVGCDGIHSATRTSYVEPDRKPIFTDVATAMTTLPTSKLSAKPFFKSTELLQGQKGSFIMSFTDPDRTELYAAAVMSMPEKKDKEGWRAQGGDVDGTKKEILRRYGDAKEELVREYVRKIEDVFFYPIYKLSGNGRWSRGRVVLLGDAAHAMPPQGESMTLAIEDAALFSRVLLSSPSKPIVESISVYEKTRRAGIEAAYDEAVSRWENVKDKSWFQSKVREWFTWAFLWLMAGKIREKWRFDIRDLKLVE